VRSRPERIDVGLTHRRVSCTRSSAQSRLPLNEIANAHKLGTGASMASRTAGEASSAGTFVVRIVEGLQSFAIRALFALFKLAPHYRTIMESNQRVNSRPPLFFNFRHAT
jgi:hypothetical protein